MHVCCLLHKFRSLVGMKKRHSQFIHFCFSFSTQLRHNLEKEKKRTQKKKKREEKERRKEKRHRKKSSSCNEDDTKNRFFVCLFCWHKSHFAPCLTDSITHLNKFLNNMSICVSFLPTRSKEKRSDVSTSNKHHKSGYGLQVSNFISGYPAGMFLLSFYY